MAKLSFLGKGFSFPFRFASTGSLRKTTGVSITSEESKINASLKYILSTQIGERPMRRDFGSGLRTLLFEPNDPSLDVRINFLIQNSIAKWEKRIILNDVKIDRTSYKNGILFISVTYTIIKSNVVGNLVFPFYVNNVENGNRSVLNVSQSL